MAVDVLVCGGGTAGCMAALAAARTGAKTLLVEREGFLGGTATYGIPFLGVFSGDGRQVISGLFQEVVDRMNRLGGCPGHIRGGQWNEKLSGQSYDFSLTPFDPECLKYTLQEMLLDAGVDLFLQATLTNARHSGPAVTTVEVMTVEGKQTLSGDLYIDCTGDALLAWLSGFPTRMRGRGKMQNVSQLIRLGNVDSDRMAAALEQGQGILGRDDWHVRQIRGRLIGGGEGVVHLAGLIDLGSEFPPATFTAVRWRKEELSLNITRTIDIDPTNAMDVSRAEISERRQIFDLIERLKGRIPGFEKAYLLSSATKVGVREGRRIEGERVLSEAEVLEARDDPQGIARGAYPIDIHDPKGGKTQFSFIDQGGSYSIPYACLIPKGSDNLLAAGRCVSTTGKALGSVRLMPCCMALGQAAGTAAALAVQEGAAPRDLSIETLRRRLKANGAIL